MVVEELITKLGFDVNMSGLKRYEAGITQSTSNIQSKLKKSSAGMRDFSTKLNSSLKSMVPTILSVGTAFTGMVKVPIDTAIAFETSFKDVKKSIDGTPQQIEKVRKELQSLAGMTGIKFSGLTDIASDAGKMGISAKNIAGFTEVIAKASSALDLNQEATVGAIGKILSMTNQMDEPIKNAQDLSDKIAKLENSLAGVKAGDIIDVWKRLSGTFNEFNFDNKSMGGISAYLMQINTSSELASSGFKTFLTRLKALGMADKIKTDGIDGLKETIKELGDMTEIDRLKKLGSVANDVYTKLANVNNMAKMDRAINVAGNSKGATDAEFEVLQATTQNKIDRLKASLANLSNEIGTPLKTAVEGILATVLPLVESFTKWASENKSLIVTVGSITAGLAGLVAVVTGLGFIISGVIAGFSAFIPVVSALAAVLGALLTPIGLIGVAIAGLLTVVVTNWDTIKTVTMDMVTAVSETITNWSTTLTTLFTTAFDGAKQVVMDAVNWIMEKVNFVLNKVNAVKNAGKNLANKALGMIGLGGDEKSPTAPQTPQTPAPQMSFPKLPDMTQAGASSSIVNNNITNAPTINVTQTNASPKEIENAVRSGMAGDNIKQSTPQTRPPAIGN